MWDLDHKESWVPENWCFWTVVVKTPESLLDCKEIQPVHPKGDQSWVFIGRIDAEAETPILGHLIQRTESLEKSQMLGRLKVGGEGDDRGWDGWMASLTQWTWVWASSGSWWWTGRPGMAAVHGAAKNLSWLSDWTELKSFSLQYFTVLIITLYTCFIRFHPNNFLFWNYYTC